MTNKRSSTADIAREVRTELDSVYKFSDSNPGIYVFDPATLDPKLQELFEIAGMSDADISTKLRKYRDRNVGATCVHTCGKLGFDYVILLPAGTISDGETAVFLGEETMHGEHQAKHSKFLNYGKSFSDVAREFIGGSGQCHMARKVCLIPAGKVLPDGFMTPRATYDQASDTFDFDMFHTVGYELAKAATTGESEWKRAMFHESDEKRLWAVYNKAVIPDVKITVPKNVENKNALREEVNEYLKAIGLKFNLSLEVDETDNRGTS